MDLPGTTSAAIFEQLAEGVIITDAEGRITFVNEAARRIYGMVEFGARLDHYTDLCHLPTMECDPYPHEKMPLARAILHGETVKDILWRIRRPDGAEVI